jgi:uncharacterized MnhB-related membrane protein
VNVLLVGALVLVVVNAAVVVTTHEPSRQAVTLCTFGLNLSLLFAVLDAPDVALSQLGVGAAIVPLMVLLAWRKHREPR